MGNGRLARTHVSGTSALAATTASTEKLVATSSGPAAWGAAAATGAVALLAASRLAYQVVAGAGALYMAVLGVSMIVRSRREDDPVPDGTDAAGRPPAGAPWRAFLTGTWTNLLNPKVGVFYIATIPQFIPAGASPFGTGLALAGVHAALTLTWFAVLILGATAARRWLARPRVLRVVDRVAGTALIGFGARLALAHRPA